MTAPTPSRAADTPAPELLLEYHSDSAVLILNRPQTRNSLSEAMLTALSGALTEMQLDSGAPRSAAAKSPGRAILMVIVSLTSASMGFGVAVRC